MYEIERKYLIEYPDTAVLKEKSGGCVFEITQTYLESTEQCERRVRKRKSSDVVEYFYTEKRKITSIKRQEDEKIITELQYIELLKQADTQKNTLCKTRYCIGHENKMLEIDVYPFWQDKAIMETELLSEEEKVSFPDFIKVIKEVTDDIEFKNSSLAKIKMS